MSSTFYHFFRGQSKVKFTPLGKTHLFRLSEKVSDVASTSTTACGAMSLASSQVWNYCIKRY